MQRSNIIDWSVKPLWDFESDFENPVLYSVSLRQPLRHIGRQEIGTELLKLSNTIYLLKASLGENTMSSGIFPCHTKTIAAGRSIVLFTSIQAMEAAAVKVSRQF